MTVRAGERAFSLAACAVMFLWPVVTTDFEHVNAISILVALAAALTGAFVAFGRAPAWLPLALAAVAGTTLRLTTATYSGSDVVHATEEALHVLASGANPYLHYYRDTNPMGQPFPYLPGELALYGIQHAVFGNLDAHDRWWSIGALLAVVAMAPVCGTGRTALAAALLAVSSTNVLIGVDGSNDNGLLFLIALAVAAFCYAARSGRAAVALYAVSAVFFGWAIAFKAFAWAIYPFVLRVVPRERRALFTAVSLGLALLFCAPFLIGSPVAFVQSIAGGFVSHDNVWGFNLWSALAASHPDVLDAIVKYVPTIGIFATLLSATTLWVRKPVTLGEALLQSAIVVAVMLFFARWTSMAYYAFLIGTLSLSVASYATAPDQGSVAKR